MIKRLLLLLIPVAAYSQEVKPVLSPDYQARIADSALKFRFLFDSTGDIRRSPLRLSGHYDGGSVTRVRIRDGKLSLQSLRNRFLYLSGSYSVSAETKQINGQPALQEKYVQGRNISGAPAWQGPETNEIFSYGPAIGDLEYDGSAYLYDDNGRLVPAGSGNGRAARVYTNNILRNGHRFAQSLRLQARYQSGQDRLLARIQFGQNREAVGLSDSRNDQHQFSAYVELAKNRFKATASWSTSRGDFSYSNRNGFLNRVYASSLLTPVSFENAQGSLLGNGQRSYSIYQDNPLFLLGQHPGGLQSRHPGGYLSVEQSTGRFRFKLHQSADRLREFGPEGYVAGTANFTANQFQHRSKTSESYLVNPTIHAELVNSGDLRLNSVLSYFVSHSKTSIGYRGKSHEQERWAQDGLLTVSLTSEGYQTRAGVKLENRSYVSSTANSRDFFLPGASGYIEWRDLFGLDNLSFRLTASGQEMKTELPVSMESAGFNLLRYRLDEVGQFLPAEELKTFRGLRPIRQRERFLRASLSYLNRITLQAEIFERRMRDDLFPVFENNEWALRNLADHRNRGLELEFTHTRYGYGNKLSVTNTVSFTSYRDLVTSVRNGYDQLAIAGFSDIHKTLIVGQPVGLITGSRYLRDPAGRLMIGSDGFPQGDPKPGVLGNPNPRFVMKFSNDLNWRRFSLGFDLEWRNGGMVWNGTQAWLDYYGRSALSGDLRGVTGYVFPGVLANGHANDRAVSFYDPTRPLTDNRWVRYGLGGIAESYMERGDYLRINNLGLNYRLPFRHNLQAILFKVYTGNWLLWSPYSGGDPAGLLFDQENTAGLDFFNLPSRHHTGFNITLQF